MSYKNGINGHKAFLVKFKDVDYYDDKMISLNNNKSKTFLKNNYTYIKFQGNYYTFSTSRAWTNAPLKVWFHKVANILLLNESEINSVVEYYKNNDEQQRQSIPDFLNATVSNDVKKILSLSFYQQQLPILDGGFYLMSDLTTIFHKQWLNLNAKNDIQKSNAPTLKSVLANA